MTAARALHRLAATRGRHVAAPLWRIESPPMVTAKPRTWVVYQLASGHPNAGNHVVCTQAEWAALDQAVPGRHTLVMGLIPNEGLAEQLDRSKQTPPEVPRPAPRSVYAILKERAGR